MRSGRGEHMSFLIFARASHGGGVALKHHTPETLLPHFVSLCLRQVSFYVRLEDEEVSFYMRLKMNRTERT